MKKKKKTNSRGIGDWIYKEIFEEVPYNIAIIDKDFNIVKANGNFAEYFGDWRQKKCYKTYKNLNAPCDSCNALLTFQDGITRVSDEAGVDSAGKPAHYVLHTAPLRRKKSEAIDYILEMSSDITETKRWQREYQLLFDRVPCYITVIDKNYKIVRANERFREEFGDVRGQQCYEVYKQRKSRCINCPAAKTFKDGRVHHSNQVGTGKRGQDIHYAVSTSPLIRGVDQVAHVIEISTDLTAMKRLERQIIEAERLGAVGQTVAGLAHSIKNILMGLEGGKYIVSLGMKKNDKTMISQGWEMLDRNFEKTTSLVKDFLSFSKGRLPDLKIVNPGELVKEIIDLYKEIAAQSGIELKAEIPEKTKKAPLDPDGIHTCLTNLVSNAIDACLMGEQKGSEVVIRIKDSKEKLVFEVYDNGSGIDYEIKKKIFTTFFTTKGGGGTGLGLLTTRKIVQEHGGKILVESKQGEGARFRMVFPRHRLMTLFKETN